MNNRDVAKEQAVAKTPLSEMLSLKTLVSLMSLSVPILYLVGYFYHVGYLSTFNVPSDYFPLSFQEYLVSAFVAFLGVYVKLLNLFYDNLWVFAGIGLLFSAMALVIILIAKNEKKLLIKKKQLVKHWSYRYLLVPSVAGVFGFSIMFVFLTLLGVIVIAPLAGYTAGISSGTDQKLKFEGCQLVAGINKSINHSCTYVYYNDVLELKGMYVTSSQDYIAIYDGEKTHIQPLQGRKIQIVGKREMNANSAITNN